MLFWLCAGVSAASTVAAIHLSRKWFAARIRGGSVQLVNEDLYGGLGVVGSILPRPLRSVWNGFWLIAAVFLLGAPHHLALFALRHASGAKDVLIYIATLLYWLGLMVVVGSFLARMKRPLSPS